MKLLLVLLFALYANVVYALFQPIASIKTKVRIAGAGASGSSRLVGLTSAANLSNNQDTTVGRSALGNDNPQLSPPKKHEMLAKKVVATTLLLLNCWLALDVASASATAPPAAPAILLPTPTIAPHDILATAASEADTATTLYQSSLETAISSMTTITRNVQTELNNLQDVKAVLEKLPYEVLDASFELKSLSKELGSTSKEMTVVSQKLIVAPPPLSALSDEHTIQSLCLFLLAVVAWLSSVPDKEWVIYYVLAVLMGLVGLL